MLTLGLDQSFSSFGWAVFDDAEILFNRCPRKGVLPAPAFKNLTRRLMYYRDALSDLLRDVTFDRVGIEAPIYGASFSEGMYALFQYCNEAILSAKSDIVYISNSQSKERVKDYLERPKKWTISKDDIIEAAFKDTGEMGRWVGDEADAYWIAQGASRFWHYHAGRLPREELKPFEVRQFDLRHTFTRGKKKGLTERSGLIYKKNESFFLWSSEEEDT